MAHSVVMPKLGNTVESSIIVKWHVEEGQRIAQDDVLCEIETDKATMDVPAGAKTRRGANGQSRWHCGERAAWKDSGKGCQRQIRQWIGRQTSRIRCGASG